MKNDKIVVKKRPNITTIFPHGESEPFVVKILPSGWEKTYHIITEWGDTGETTHKLMDVIELLDFYKMDVNDLPSKDIFCVSKSDTLAYPNNYDLGEIIRKKLHE